MSNPEGIPISFLTLALSNAFQYAFVAWIAYYIAVSIYRIHFHPLAKLPGPKLAALTYWYEFYYDVYPYQFQYGFRIKQLHEQYGPIVRINPRHIHIHDHEYFDTIYASGANHRRDRCSWMHHSGSRTMAGSMLEAMDHDLHKSRRSAVSNFFSKRSVQALEPLVLSSVERLVQRLKDEETVNLNNAFAAMTMDIISAYCFGESMNSLEYPQYGKDWLEMLHGGIQMRPLGRQFPWLVNTLYDIPPNVMARFNADMARINTWTHQMLPKIVRILAGEDEKRDVQRTVFHEIRDGKMSAEEKLPMRLMGESHVILGAGTETTARTLAVTTYYLMKKHDVGEKLRDELKTVLSQPDSAVSLAQLEALPYLSAVINEGLRVAHGVASRQPRIATHEDLIYKQWTIPRGTPVMQSSHLLHMDPNVFPDPLDFQPQRWLDNPELKRNLFAFGRGTRNCLGMNLAISELYFAIALLWRRLDTEIYDTVEERDVLTTNDCFLGMTDLKSEGIKARIVGVVEK
ncbi:putative benzoate 4-monooxygenase cytochrome P450 [Ophiobolus disseminans]|uniref:Putative benzoate 4-monooxygenase cytochrome P450 n=1 Tax=Ophiobolus disseminans TaxID=1469910 RepID=A0A6A7AHR3_9PLEO|nr:putative benzoate 4-monooxygenase cytochrome P450 [Ophiobolus disseminans]